MNLNIAENLEIIQKTSKILNAQSDDLTKSIIELGQREKEKVIEMAKITADQMMEDARKESQYRLTMAKNALKDEMVEIAVSLVEERLKEKISLEDDKMLVNQFIDGLDTSSKQFA